MHYNNTVMMSFRRLYLPLSLIVLMLTIVAWTIANRSDITDPSPSSSGAGGGIASFCLVFKVFISTATQQLTWPTLLTCVISTVTAVCVFYAYQVLFTPLNRVRLLGDVGYIPEGRLSKKDLVNLVRKRRFVGDIPPVYPNGWFCLLESRDLAVAEAKMVSCLGMLYT